MDGRHHRLLATIEGADDLPELRVLRRLAELRDVRAGHEGASPTPEDQGLHAVVRQPPLERQDQPSAYVMADRVHRRVVDDYQADRPTLFEPDHLKHAFPSGY